MVSHPSAMKPRMDGARRWKEVEGVAFFEQNALEEWDDQRIQVVGENLAQVRISDRGRRRGRRCRGRFRE